MDKINSEDYDSYYDQIAEGYNDLHGNEQINKLNLIFSRDNVKYFIDSSNVDNFKVLDCGCGTGICQDYLKEKFNISSTGIDPSKGLLMRNKNLCLYAYAENIPFLDDEFNLVISLTAIQNFTDVKNGLNEILRVGKNKFILSYLKKSGNAEEIKLFLTEVFESLFNIEFIEEEKDIIALIGF